MDRYDCPGFPAGGCRHGGFDLPFWRVLRRQPPGGEVGGYCETCAEDIGRAWFRLQFNTEVAAATPARCPNCHGETVAGDVRQFGHCGDCEIARALGAEKLREDR